MAGAELVVGLDTVLRAVHGAFELWVAQVAQRVDAADELVELEDRAPRWIRRGVGAQLADQRALGHLLQSQRGDDVVDVRFLVDDHLQIDLADRAHQTLLIEGRGVGTVEFLRVP